MLKKYKCNEIKLEFSYEKKTFKKTVKACERSRRIPTNSPRKFSSENMATIYNDYVGHHIA